MLMWILYVMLVSALLGAAALAAENRARIKRKAIRWYWISAILASLLIPTVIASVSIELPDIFSSPKTIVLRDVTSDNLSPFTWISKDFAAVSESHSLDTLIKKSWLWLSVFLLVGLIASGAHLLWRKRQWQKSLLINTPVLITSDVGPAVAGLINSQIVIPQWVLDLPVSQQQAILAHEQSHLDAGDPALLTIAIGLLVFMPWNIPLWWQLHRLRGAIEVDCDARVLREGQSVKNYGETLIAVAQRQSRYMAVVAGMSESQSFLEKRINIMITKPAKKWWHLSAMAFGFASIGLVAIAAQVSPPNANSTQNEASVAEQKASPGTEDALRKLIATLASENPDYSIMSADMAKAVKEQWPQLHGGALYLGELQSLEFRQVENGWDLYDAKHQNGSTEWRIILSSTGTIVGAWVSNKK